MKRKRKFDEFDKALLTEAHRQRIDELWSEMGICGAKPLHYLGRLKKLHDAGLDVTDCQSIPGYGQLDDITKTLIDRENDKEAYKDWLNDVLRTNMQRVDKSEAQKASVTARKSKNETDILVGQYRQAHPNHKRLVATLVADWAIQEGLCPFNERRNLIARLKRGFAS